MTNGELTSNKHTGQADSKLGEPSRGRRPGAERRFDTRIDPLAAQPLAQVGGECRFLPRTPIGITLPERCVWAMGPGVWGHRRSDSTARAPRYQCQGELNEALQALPAKAESEPATWPTAMAESKCTFPLTPNRRFG